MQPTIRLTAILLSYLVFSSSGAWAQRGGSIRYSGASFQNSGGTAVRYQKPMNMPGGAYRNGAAGYQNTGGYNAASVPVRYQAPVNMPVGSAVRTLPVGYRPMAVAGRNYYYYGGAYYMPDEMTDSSQPQSYTVVAPPLGATVDTLPAGAQEISPGLYSAGGVKYRPSYDDGKIVYVVSN